MNQSISIRISDNMRKNLKAISKIEGKSLNDLVRESLQKYIAVFRFRQLRNMVLPFAEVQGILTDKDIYKDI